MASSDSTLSNISGNTGQISPAFSKDIKDYVVYLPYEAVGTTYIANGTMSDSKAVGVTEGSVVLAEGKNEVKVVGTAEDGSTSEYKITVVVMPKYEGKVPVIEGSKEPETEPITEPDKEEGVEQDSDAEVTTEELTTVAQESTEEVNKDSNDGKSGFGIGSVVIVAIAGLLLGFILSYFIFNNKKTGK